MNEAVTGEELDSLKAQSVELQHLRVAVAEARVRLGIEPRMPLVEVVPSMAREILRLRSES